MSNIVLADEKNKLFTALSSYATALANLTDEQVPQAFDMTDQLEDLAKEVRTRLRDRLLLYVQANGTKATDKGSMKAEAGGYRLVAIPTRTGIDPKKLEALLRRKGIDPAGVMDTTITYKVNLAKLSTTSCLTQTELDACLYDKAFRVEVARMADEA